MIYANLLDGALGSVPDPKTVTHLPVLFQTQKIILITLLTDSYFRCVIFNPGNFIKQEAQLLLW